MILIQPDRFLQELCYQSLRWYRAELNLLFTVKMRRLHWSRRRRLTRPSFSCKCLRSGTTTEAPSSPSSAVSTMETAEQLPAAEAHLAITQSSYATQSQSKHAWCSTNSHTHRESQWPSLQFSLWGQMPNQKLTNVASKRTPEAEWNDSSVWEKGSTTTTT